MKMINCAQKCFVCCQWVIVCCTNIIFDVLGSVLKRFVFFMRLRLSLSWGPAMLWSCAVMSIKSNRTIHGFPTRTSTKRYHLSYMCMRWSCGCGCVCVCVSTAHLLYYSPLFIFFFSSSSPFVIQLNAIAIHKFILLRMNTRYCYWVTTAYDKTATNIVLRKDDRETTNDSSFSGGCARAIDSMLA